MIILNFGLEFRFLDRNRLLFLQCQCRKKYLILSFNFVKLYIDNSKFFHIRLLTLFGYLVACKRYLQFFEVLLDRGTVQKYELPKKSTRCGSVPLCKMSSLKKSTLFLKLCLPIFICDISMSSYISLNVF